MSAAAGGSDLARLLEARSAELDTCVHCGFCLPACPTYLRLGDEADSPRGRLHLMRAVAERRLDPASDAFQTHIDRCLGCRACEPVCPSGVPYGALLEHAREAARGARAPARPVRALLAVFRTPRRTRWVFGLARAGRDLGLARLAARVLPRSGWVGAVRRAFLMLAGSAPWRSGVLVSGGDEPPPPEPRSASPAFATAGVLDGCVQASLFARVGKATKAVLAVHGVSVASAPGQGCCGALHAHAGDRVGARDRARANIAAFEAAGVERVVVDAAGCGAAMKDYGDWLADDPAWRDRARAFSARVLDVHEALALLGPRTGAPLVGTVVHHPPCHLHHAQKIRDAPLRVLGAIPGLEVRHPDGSGECCGGAGLYGVTHPELGGLIGSDRARALADTEAGCVASGNPGCMMQLAAHLDDEGASLEVAHPVELLAESYRRAGWIDGRGRVSPRIRRGAP